MLLLLAEQGLEAVLGLSGGLLVLGQLVTGGAQGFNGLDAGLVEVVEIVEGAAQLGRILLVEQQFEVIVVARLEGAFACLASNCFWCLACCSSASLSCRDASFCWFCRSCCLVCSSLAAAAEMACSSALSWVLSLASSAAELEGLLLFLDLGPLPPAAGSQPGLCRYRRSGKKTARRPTGRRDWFSVK
jgi:hypothetical protein